MVVAEWKHRAVLHQGLPQLLGTIIEVRSRVFSNSAAYARKGASDEPVSLLLIYADGREVILEPTGCETDGLGVYEPSEPEEKV